MVRHLLFDLIRIYVCVLFLEIFLRTNSLQIPLSRSFSSPCLYTPLLKPSYFRILRINTHKQAVKKILVTFFTMFAGDSTDGSVNLLKGCFSDMPNCLSPIKESLSTDVFEPSRDGMKLNFDVLFNIFFFPLPLVPVSWRENFMQLVLALGSHRKRQASLNHVNCNARTTCKNSCGVKPDLG